MVSTSDGWLPRGSRPGSSILFGGVEGSVKRGLDNKVPMDEPLFDNTLEDASINKSPTGAVPLEELDFSWVCFARGQMRGLFASPSCDVAVGTTP